MGRKPKSAEVRARFFAARASGATLKQAATAAGISRTAGHYWLAQSGGVRPRSRRPRPALRLSLEERESISRGLAQRKTFTAIAAGAGQLGVDSGTGRSSATAARTGTGSLVLTGWRRLARPGRGWASLPSARELRRYVEDKLRSAGHRARSASAW